jgi:hypothetical protein
MILLGLWHNPFLGACLDFLKIAPSGTSAFL